MKWILIFIAVIYTAQQAEAVFVDGDARTKRLKFCDSLPFSFESYLENAKIYYECGLVTEYFPGVLDSYESTKHMNFCVPDGIKFLKVKELVRNWFAKHPERWHERTDRLVLAAIYEAWPCPD